MTLRIIVSDPAKLFGKVKLNSSSFLSSFNNAVEKNSIDATKNGTDGQPPCEDTNCDAFYLSDAAAEIRKSRFLSTKLRLLIASENEKAGKSAPLFKGKIALYPDGDNFNNLKKTPLLNIFKKLFTK